MSHSTDFDVAIRQATNHMAGTGVPMILGKNAFGATAPAHSPAISFDGPTRPDAVPSGTTADHNLH